MKQTDKFFMGKYMLSFYSKESDYDELIYFCDNLRELGDYLNIPYDSKEFKALKAKVAQAIGRKKLHGECENHFKLDGHYCKCFLIDTTRDAGRPIYL